MFLKSLELNGFKSFAQKTVLEFPERITAIVGPNGSGKSNIIDAIRWILGEREAKNLRGAKAEDLIFAGTLKRPRVAVAKVGIHFDNNSGFFPVSFEEVSITKEIGRDGNSAYWLNKSEVRTKDAIDFFARSRLGTKGITIINQGSSDLFVRALPQERKLMIEEVLGLKEYQLKKSEAERKLQTTCSTLEKIKLMVEEVTPRLRLLKRQAAKYQARDEKKEELIKLENVYFAEKTKNIKTELGKNNSLISDLENKISQKSKELETLEADLNKVESTDLQKTAIHNLKSEENDLSSRRSQIQREIGKIEAQSEFLEALKNDGNEETFKKDDLVYLIKDIKNNLEESLNAGDLEKVSKIIKSLISKIDGFLKQPSSQNSKELNNLGESRENLAKELSIIEEGLKKIKDEEEKSTKNLETFNERFKRAFELKESKKEEIRALENRKNYLFFENEKSNIKLGDLKNEWLKNERSLDEFNNLHLISHIPSPTSNFDDLEKKIFRLRAELMSIGEIDESLIKEAKEVEAHYNFLSSQLNDLEKASADLKNLIEELKEEISLKFNTAFKGINEEFNNFFKLMFGGGSAKLKIKTNDQQQTTNDEKENTEDQKPENEGLEENAGVEIELSLPKKRIKSLDVLSGGEKSLVSIAALFALISVSPPPFLVLDEIDAPLDEPNSKRFADLIKEFAHKVQFILVTHNRTVMEIADILYGVTMNEDGTSKLLSLKLEEAPAK